MFLMFDLGRPDVFRGGDLGLRRGIQIAYELEEMPTPEEAVAIAERWRPHRTLASLYLWEAVHANPQLTASAGLASSRPPLFNGQMTQIGRGGRGRGDVDHLNRAIQRSDDLVGSGGVDDADHGAGLDLIALGDRRTAATVPAAGPCSSCSIFIASRTATTSPRLDRRPLVDGEPDHLARHRRHERSLGERPRPRPDSGAARRGRRCRPGPRRGGRPAAAADPVTPADAVGDQLDRSVAAGAGGDRIRADAERAEALAVDRDLGAAAAAVEPIADLDRAAGASRSRDPRGRTGCCASRPARSRAARRRRRRASRAPPRLRRGGRRRRMTSGSARPS